MKQEGKGHRLVWAEPARHIVMDEPRKPQQTPVAEGPILHLSLELELDWLEGFPASSLRYFIVHIPAATLPNTHNVSALIVSA